MFKARFSRREAGGYDAAYGKGTKQLSAILEKVGGKWRISQGFAVGQIEASAKIADVKAEWGAKAEQAYGGETSIESAPALPVSRPPPLRPGGPPSIKRIASAPSQMPQTAAVPCVAEPYDGPTCDECKAPLRGWHDNKPPCKCAFPYGPDYQPDPFDPRMWEYAPGTARTTNLTPTGALDKIYAWMCRPENRDYITTDGVLDSPWCDAQETLFRTLGYAEYRPGRILNGSAQPESPTEPSESEPNECPDPGCAGDPD